MTSTVFVFPLLCGREQTAYGSVASTDSGGWDVRVQIDDRVVFTRHCTEWHRVERLCAELQWHVGADSDADKVDSRTSAIPSQ